MSVFTKSDSEKHLDFLRILMPAGHDRWITGCVLALVLYGVIMVGSASMGIYIGKTTQLLITVIKQILYAVIGYYAMNRFARYFSLKFLKSDAFPSLVFFTFIILMVCLLFPNNTGSRAWIYLPIGITEVSVQPSEFAKIVVLLIVAAYCGDLKARFKTNFDVIKKPVFFCGLIVFIVLILQHDLGSAVVIFLLTCISFLIPSHPQMRHFQFWLKLLFWLTVILVIMLLSPAGEKFIDSLKFLEPYQKARIISAIDPFSDRYGEGYQLVNGLVSFATGGWFGLGYGHSVRKYMNFPAANTDYILAVLVEELGFVGFMVLMVLYGIVIFRLLTYAKEIQSEKARIILIGTAMYLLIHMFFNIGGVTGLIPLTGVPLLMISAGGSSTMSFMAAIGICQAVIIRYQNGEIR
ncbi:MAG: FtsW/RodA/SpoVE family cell cycle protein [Solobacterium sp.]|nr:FtsW/RodA/SpoVE family cell cycle protein [Solobacterium sp.]